MALVNSKFFGKDTESSLLESNIELYPDFTNPICTIEFIGLNNTVIESLSVKARHKFTVPSIPQIDGYDIIGWDKEIVNRPVEDAIYVAQYAIRSYTIKFYGIDDTLLSTQNLNSGETVQIPEVPDVGTLSFVNWNKPVKTNAVADADYFACPEESEITFTYNGETYTHGIFSYDTMNDLYNKLQDSHKSLRYKDQPYYKSSKNETIKSIKYSSIVKYAVMSEHNSYFDIDYDSLEEVYIEMNSDLINNEKYKDKLTVKDTVRIVDLINAGKTYNKIVDLHNVKQVFMTYEGVDCYFGFKRLIVPGNTTGSIYNADVVHFVEGTGLPSDIQYQIQYGRHRILIGDDIYNNISGIPDYKLNENIASTNTDSSYYCLIADNTDWIDSENIYIYDSKRTKKLGRYNIETYVFTKTLFTLTFNSNGGPYVEPITQEYGTKVTVPKPTREGFTLIGWDPTLPSTMPAYDMTFTAKWLEFDNQIENVVTGWDEEKVGICTGVYPTINTRMSIEASNLYGESDIFVGIAKDGTIPWKNDNGDNPDNSDWRLFMYGGSIYWDFGNRRKQIDYTGSKCRYECSSKGFEVYDITNKNLIYSDVDYYLTSINVSNYPIWIAPMTSRKHYATYYGIMIYEGEQLIRHYIPWRDKDGVVCFKDRMSDTLCYPQVGTWKSTNHHTFTFKSNGGTDVAEIKEYYGTAIVAPSDPTREGYTFMGWDKEIPSTMPDHDIIFTAQWQINQHTFTLNTNGGQYIAPIIQDYGTEVTAPDPTREGYTFIGWTFNGREMDIPTKMPDYDMTFTAKWDKCDRQIDNVVTGWDREKVGICTGVYPTINTKMIIVASELYGKNEINIGMSYDGTKDWSEGLDTDSTYYKFSAKTVSGYAYKLMWQFGNSSIYTQWMNKKCTYICSSKGLKIYDGDDITDSSKIIKDESFNPTTINLPHYPIWIVPRTYLEQHGTYYDIKIYEGDELLRHYIPWRDKDGVVCFKEEISNELCYPQVGTWDIKRKTSLIFNSNGGTYVEPITQEYGMAVVVPADPTRKGYHFMGWDKQIPEFMPNRNMTFTANWKKIK